MKRLFLILILSAISGIAGAQSLNITGPSNVCLSTFATFDSDPVGIDNITSIQWEFILNGNNVSVNYLYGSPSSSDESDRSIMVEFIEAGTYTVRVTYHYDNNGGKEQSVTDIKEVTVTACPRTDCAGTKADGAFLAEDFGTFTNSTDRRPLDPPATTTYAYESSSQIEDGSYTISSNPQNAHSDWVSTGDHTGDTYGGMMIVNASYEPDTFYTRVINGLCTGAQYSFNAWLLNVNSKNVLQNVCSGSNIFPNVSFVVLDAKTDSVLGRTNTGDVSMNLNGPEWQQYGFGFKTPVGVDSVKLIMYNIAPGGCGNDLAIDDIQFTYCGPTEIALFDNGTNSDTICAGTNITIHSSVTTDYFIDPEYQWQVSTDEVNWTDIPGATQPDYTILATDTSDSKFYRFRVAEKGNLGKSTCNSPSTTASLLVLEAPFVDPGDTTICPGTSATLRAKPGYTSYNWTIEGSDSSIGTTSSITVSPTATTKYFVTATLSSGDAGACTSTDSSLVTVFDSYSIELGNDTTLCGNDSLLLEVKIPDVQYLWNTGDTTRSIWVKKAGTYWVSVTNGICEPAKDTIIVDYADPPTVNLGNDTAICQGNSVTLRVNGNSGDTYKWNNNDALSLDSLVIDTTGDYWLQVKNEFGCTASDTMHLTVHELPIVDLGDSLQICAGDSVILYANGQSGDTFLWNDGSTLDSLVIDTTGDYWLQVKNEFGCTASDTMHLTVHELPTVDLGDSLQICAGDSVILYANGQSGDTFLWNDGSTLDSLVIKTTGDYWLQVKNEFGCTASDTIHLTVHELPIVDLGDSLQICSGDSVILYANGQSGDTFLWNDGSTLDSLVIDTTGDYWLQVKNEFGCTASDTMHLTVHELPTFDLGSDTAICSGDSVILYANGNSSDTFLWNDGSMLDSLVIDTTGDYWLQVKNEFGCTASDTMHLTVHELPTFDLGSDTAICSGDSVILYANGNSSDTFLWNDGSMLDSLVIDTTGDYWLQVKNEFGCTASDTMHLTVHDLPTVDLGDSLQICAGDNVILYANGNSGDTFLWNDGSTLDSLVIDTSGEYWLQVKNEFGCTASDTMHLTVHELPVVDLDIDREICSGDSVILYANGNSGDTFLWNDGSTLDSLVIDTTGDYWLQVENEFGCTASDTMHLTVHELPTFDLGSDTAICSGNSVTLRIEDKIGDTYKWNDNDALTLDSLVIDTTGDYWLQVENEFGCTASDTMHLTVHDLPIVELGDSLQICSGDSVILYANGNSGDTFLWNDGSTLDSLVIKTTGDYWLQVKNEFGCTASDTMHLTVHDLPTVDLGDSLQICSGDSVILYANDNSGDTFLWNDGSTLDSLVIKTTGDYWLQVKNEFGCTASDTMHLTVHELPTVDLGDSLQICAGDSIILRANGQSGDTFLWNDGSTLDSLVIKTTGDYWLQVENEFGCTASDTMHLTVHELPTFDLGDDTAICFGNSVTLRVEGNSGDTFLWSGGSTLDSLVIDTSGDYWLQVENEYGCTASDTMHLTVHELPTVDLGDDTAICFGNSVTLRVEGNSGDTFLWSGGSTLDSLVIKTTGDYWLQVKNEFGCTASDTMHLTAHELPIVELADSLQICAGDSVILYANGQSGDTFLWNDGSTLDSLIIKTTGDYWLQVKNEFGCTASDTMHLTVHELPTVDLADSLQICAGDSVILYANGQSGDTFLWNDGSTLDSLVIKTTGDYWLQVENEFGCTASDTMHLTVHELPTVDLADSLQICAGDSVILYANGQSGDTFLWSGGSTLDSLVIDTSGDYWLQVKNEFGCTASDTMHLTVHELPTVDLADSLQICTGDSVILYANGQSGDTFLWNDGSTLDSLVIKTTGDYWLQVKNEFGCTASDTMHLTVHELPTVDLADSLQICAGDSVILYANGQSGDTFLWSGGSTLDSLVIDTSGDYWLQVKNEFGCTASDTMHLTVHELPTFDLGDDTAICFGNSVTLRVEGNSGDTFLWNDNSSLTLDSLVIDTTGDYWLQVENEFGCTASDTMHLTVHELPTFDLGDDTAICFGNSVTLRVEGNSGDTFLWSGGSTLDSLVIKTTGDYWLQVKNEFGCTASDTMHLTAHELPIVELADSLQICAGDSVILYANGQNGDTFLWSGGSTLDSLVIKTTGDYWLQVENEFGCTASDTMHLTVHELPIVELGEDTAICRGASLTLDAGNPGATYLWNTGETSQTITVNKADDYSVTVTDGNGCSASGTILVGINELPTVELGNDTAICQGANLTLDAGNPSATFLWSTGEITQTIMVNSENNYSVMVKDGNGCSASDNIHVGINELPTVELGSDTAICSGSNLILDAGNPGADFLWSTGEKTQKITIKNMGVYSVKVISPKGCIAGDTIQVKVEPLPKINPNRKAASLCEGESMKLDPTNGRDHYTYQWQNGSTSPSISVSKAGSYWVIISNGRCLIRDTINVRLQKNTLPDLSPGLDICPGDSVTIDASSDDAIAYQWSTGAITPSITVSNAGRYTLKIQGKYCDYVRKDTIEIKVHPLPSVELTADDISICEGEAVHLKATGKNTDYYLWRNGSMGNILTVYKPGTYTVAAYNQCGYTSGSINLMSGGACTAALFMPNAFTPNHDGKNDSFGPKIILSVSDYEMRIFNRWGQLLFVTHDHNARWDGTFNGKPCLSGGYVWWLRYHDPISNTDVFKKGALTLIR